MMVVTSWINYSKTGAIAPEMSSSSNKNVQYESMQDAQFNTSQGTTSGKGHCPKLQQNKQKMKGKKENICVIICSHVTWLLYDACSTIFLVL